MSLDNLSMFKVGTREKELCQPVLFIRKSLKRGCFSREENQGSWQGLNASALLGGNKNEIKAE